MLTPWSGVEQKPPERRWPWPQAGSAPLVTAEKQRGRNRAYRGVGGSSSGQDRKGKGRVGGEGGPQC